MNNAMLAKERREAPLTRPTDLRANARPRPAHLVKPFDLKGGGRLPSASPTASPRSSIEHALVVVADCVTTIANSFACTLSSKAGAEGRPLGPRPR
jgi:hypothetical protein